MLFIQGYTFLGVGLRPLPMLPHSGDGGGAGARPDQCFAPPGHGPAWRRRRGATASPNNGQRPGIESTISLKLKNRFSLLFNKIEGSTIPVMHRVSISTIEDNLSHPNTFCKKESLKNPEMLLCETPESGSTGIPALHFQTAFQEIIIWMS